jgi:hypothetical protein
MDSEVTMWYEVTCGKIEPLKVVSETYKTITYIHEYWGVPTRLFKHRSLFRTEAEAVNCLREILTNNLKAAHSQWDAFIAKYPNAGE